MNVDELLQGDRQLQSLIEGESQRQQFQALVHKLTSQCWDKCMTERPSTRLDTKTESCLVNCVERFLDSTNFIVNRMERTAGLSTNSALNSPASSHLEDSIISD